MRVHFIGIAIFATAFVMGISLVIDITTPEIIDEAKFATKPVVIESAPPSNTIIESQNQDEYFVPEFRNLPNFEDTESSYETKLIDVFEIDNVYRESEVIARRGEIWLGLFENGSESVLETVKIALQSTPPGQGWSGEEDSVSIKFARQSIPVFLLKNANSLKSGPVKTVYRRPSIDEIDRQGLTIEPLAIGHTKHLDLNGMKYTLRVGFGTTSDGSKVNVLVLETDKTSQIVTYNHHYRDKNTNYDIIGDLLWAGDLDGDGNVDLYFSDFDYEKGAFGTNLFLSSQADSGKLVKQVASFGVAGC